MKSKKYIVGAAAFALILTAGIGSVSAYQGDYSKAGPNCTPERHEAMETAFENNDYDAWKNQMSGRGRVAQVINQDNFADFAKAHKLGQSGDIAGADAIRAELGLRGSNGERMGAGHRGGNGERSGQKSGQGQKNGGGNYGGLNQ